MAAQYGLPPEFVGRIMNLSDLNAIENRQIKAAPTVRTTTDPLGLTTQSVTTKELPQYGGGPARPAGSAPRGQARPAVPGGGGGANSVNNIAQQLVEGTMDPSQLPRRSAAYLQILDKANAYSQQKYGKPFDIAQATTDYKFANEPATQNTLKYLNSLTGSQAGKGNLDKLVSQSDALSRTDFPALNNAEAWARLQTGDPQIAGYRTTVLEVADQVAKILQGGGTGSGTSDTKLQQAASLFSIGFTKDQMRQTASDLRDLLGNRKRELIGGNRYLQKQFSGSSSGGGTNGQPTHIWTPNGLQPVGAK
jgi:hypothetical protein